MRGGRRDAARAPVLPGAEVALATYDDPVALAAALGPGDRVFMVSMHAAYDERLRLHRAIIDAAARAGVGRVVYLSFVNAGPEASFRHARSHGATEAMHAVTITTPDAVTAPGLAAIARAVTGAPYRYEPQPREARVEHRRSLGRPDRSIEAGAGDYDGVARGEADVVADDYRALTGRDPLPIRALVELLRDRLPLSRASRSGA